MLLLSVYFPTMTNPNKNKRTFYNQLTSVLRDILHSDKLLLIGDFNARIGSDNDKSPMGKAKHGLGNGNPMISFYWLCGPSSS